MCRGDHWSPADLTQQRFFRGNYLTDKRARASNARPNKSFFDSLKYTSCSRHQWRTKLLLFRKTAIKIPRNFVRGILWCTIGDSNPGPTD